MNEKDKLELRKAMLENAIMLAKKKQDFLGLDLQEEIDELLDEWKQCDKELKDLEPK